MRVSLVVNPRSRRGRRFGAAVRVQLIRMGVEPVAESAPGGPLDAIVVAGGDGTFARQISRAIELDVPIGLVPLGTFNDLARTLAIPFDLGAACALIAMSSIRRPAKDRRLLMTWDELSIAATSKLNDSRLEASPGKNRLT